MMRWLVSVSCLLLSLYAGAASGPWGESGPVRARLISSAEGIAGQTELLLGVQIQLDPGWKTYWRVPGAAGAAPSLNLKSSLLQSDPVLYWPAPKRFNLLEMQAYGYSGEVVLPARVALIASLQSLSLRGSVDVYACNELCLPLTVPLALTISADDPVDWESQRLLNRYMARVPATAELPTEGVVASFDEQGLYLSFPLEKQGKIADLFLENYEVHDWPDPRVEAEAGRIRAWWEAPEGITVEAPVEPLRFTYVDTVQAFESSVMARPEERPASQEGYWFWGGIILLAWLGGLILNVMPCVLPVLSMKLVHLSEAHAISVHEMRSQLLFSALGIMTFFWLMSLMLTGLKSAGYYVGWGIQFQSPYFLLFMLLLMLMFSANLFGWFEFGLPARWQTAVALAGGEGKGSPRFASFIQGGAATLLSTPCSAPFLGTAVAFALTQGWLEMLLIFTALGAGLATPYGLLALFPRWVNRMPRPGRWMGKLRHMLGLGMMAAALWLLWLLSNHFDPLGLSVVAAAASVWFLVWNPKLSRWRSVRVWLGGMLLLIPLLVQPEVSAEAYNRYPLVPDKIPQLVGAGKTVFVDVTADWCITCKYNEAMVLESPEIRELITEKQIVFMRGDWSMPDPMIEAFLQRHVRSGIPFNVVYGPGAPSGFLLPELLTTANVRAAVSQAQTP